MGYQKYIRLQQLDYSGGNTSTRLLDKLPEFDERGAPFLVEQIQNILNLQMDADAGGTGVVGRRQFEAVARYRLENGRGKDLIDLSGANFRSKFEVWDNGGGFNDPADIAAAAGIDQTSRIPITIDLTHPKWKRRKELRLVVSEIAAGAIHITWLASTSTPYGALDTIEPETNMDVRVWLRPAPIKGGKITIPVGLNWQIRAEQQTSENVVKLEGGTIAEWFLTRNGTLVANGDLDTFDLRGDSDWIINATDNDQIDHFNHAHRHMRGPAITGTTLVRPGLGVIDASVSGELIPILDLPMVGDGELGDLATSKGKFRFEIITETNNVTFHHVVTRINDQDPRRGNLIGNELEGQVQAVAVVGGGLAAKSPVVLQAVSQEDNPNLRG